jgi:hypothetical protein
MGNEKKTVSDLAGDILRGARAIAKFTGETEGARNRVLTFRQWCAVNAFSLANGPAPDQGRQRSDCARRIGIRESDNAAWQASRVR